MHASISEMAKAGVEEGEIPEPAPEVTLPVSTPRKSSPSLPNVDPYAAHNVSTNPSSSADLYPRAPLRPKHSSPPVSTQEKTTETWKDPVTKQQQEEVTKRPRPPPPTAPFRPSAQLQSASELSVRGSEPAFIPEHADSYRAQTEYDAYTRAGVNGAPRVDDYDRYGQHSRLSYSQGGASIYPQDDRSAYSRREPVGYSHDAHPVYSHDEPPPFAHNEQPQYPQRDQVPYPQNEMAFQQDANAGYVRNGQGLYPQNDYDYNRDARPSYWQEKNPSYDQRDYARNSGDEPATGHMANSGSSMPQEYSRFGSEEPVGSVENERAHYRGDDYSSYRESQEMSYRRQDVPNDNQFHDHGYSYNRRDQSRRTPDGEVNPSDDGAEGHGAQEAVSREFSAHHVQPPPPPPSSTPPPPPPPPPPSSLAQPHIPQQHGFNESGGYSPTDPYSERATGFNRPEYPAGEQGYRQNGVSRDGTPSAENEKQLHTRPSQGDYTSDGYDDTGARQFGSHIGNTVEAPTVIPHIQGQAPTMSTVPVFPFPTAMSPFTMGFNSMGFGPAPPFVSGDSLPSIEPRPILVQEVEDEEAPAPRSAQHLREEPSAVEVPTKEKPFQRKKSAKIDLKALKAKALMKLKQKKLENKSVQKEEDVVDSRHQIHWEEEQHTRIVQVPIADNYHILGRSGDFGISFYPGAEGKSMSDEKLIVHFSDSEDGSESEEDEKGASDISKSLAKPATLRMHDKQRLRNQLIEDMKIRSVQLGKCPTILLSKGKKRQESGNEKLIPSSPKAPLGEDIEKKISTTPVTPPSRENDECASALTSGEGIEIAENESIRANPGVSSSSLGGPNHENTEGTSSQNASPGSDKQIVSPRAEIPSVGDELSKSASQRTLAPVSAPPLMLSKTEKKDNIETLRKRIAELERKQSQRHNSNPGVKKSSETELPTQGAKSTDFTDPIVSKRFSSTASEPQRVVPKKRARPKSLSEVAEKAAGPETGRYFSMEVYRKGGKSSSARTNSQSPKTSEASALEMEIETVPTSVETDTPEEPQSVWNQREEMKTEVRTQENTHTGLVKDLQSELETSKRQLATVQDYSRLIMAADVSLAQASAKLQFKRNRMRGLEEDLRKAQVEVDEAEHEYETMESAAKRLRSSVEDLPFAESLFPPPDVADEERNSGKEGSKGRNGTKQEDVPDRVGTANADDTNVDVMDLTGPCGSDLVLQPSPYTPATGNMFSSCLSGLRAFVLRIPHHSQASDRKSQSPLSLTWTHNLDPMKIICPRELKRRCPDKNCEYEHLRNVKSSVGHALDVVEQIQGLFDETTVREAEKDIVRTKIDIYSGKNVDQAVLSLIQTLCPVPTKLPISRPSEQRASEQ